MPVLLRWVVRRAFFAMVRSFRYGITSSARTSTRLGIMMPSPLAVRSLITNSNRLTCS